MTTSGSKWRPSTDTTLGRALDGILTSPKATVGAVVALLLVLTAIFGPWLAPQNPYDLGAIDFFDARLPPMSPSMNGSIYLLGTDGQGRDMLSAMIYGLRTSIAVGLLSGIVALVVGTALGMMAAYVGGRSIEKVARILCR